MKIQDHQVLNVISQAIFDKKGCNILVLDIREISSMADYLVIAEGSVDRHVKSLYAIIKDQLAELGLEPYHVEGVNEGDWIVVDYGSIMIHLFIPEMREKYALEALWNRAKIVDVDIIVSEELSASSIHFVINRGL
jgi:ribosome-associated protein